ncbi:uncharacterized protein LOC128740893 [Sabethes cyaneus]|uniref:uncharacterized protein LOC128740893 n=1 Tax=Sabethes cyaneus TaxID=53552 RepID=UPI00237D52D3|nr:uncharacterized protein LOC128740893 [Sabethes cyaneus]
MCLKVLWIFAFICASCSGTHASKYVTKYDSINLDEVFKSTRLLNNYLNCLKNLGPCTPDGVELKDKLPDALESDCEHCSERQKTGADKVIHFIIENRPEDFRVLESLYDPTGEYRRKYLDDRQQFREVPSKSSSDEAITDDTTDDAGADAGTDETKDQEATGEDAESTTRSGADAVVSRSCRECRAVKSCPDIKTYATPRASSLSVLEFNFISAKVARIPADEATGRYARHRWRCNVLFNRLPTTAGIYRNSHTSDENAGFSACELAELLSYPKAPMCDVLKRFESGRKVKVQISPPTMKFIVVALALVVLVAAQDDKYTTKYDSIDVDEILKSDRLFSNYFKCLMDEGACTPEGNELKRVLPDALENNCSKCSEKQKETSTKVIKNLTENRPEQWKALKAKFDPDNKYIEKYSEDADKDGIKL